MHVSEKPTFKQLAGGLSAVGSHEWLIGPLSTMMDRTRYKVLASADLADDQDRSIVVGNHSNRLLHRPHCSAGSDYFASACLAFW